MILEVLPEAIRQKKKSKKVKIRKEKVNLHLFADNMLSSPHLSNPPFHEGGKVVSADLRG